MIIIYITPSLMILLGYLWIYRYPSKINNNFGYRSNRAKSSEEAWVFANKLFARVFFFLGLFSLIFTRFSIKILSTSVISTIQILIMGLAILITEGILRFFYNKNGKRKR